MMKILRLVTTTLIMVTIAGCQLLPENAQLRSYRVLVQQGNVIEESKVDALKINMSKKQVTFLMGEPIVSNIFDKNRWDYVYYRKRDPEQTILNIVSIFFEEERIVSMKRIVKNDDGLFDVQAGSSEFPEFIEDKETASVKNEIFEDIELEGIKGGDTVVEEFLSKSQLDDLEEQNIAKKVTQNEAVENKAAEESINISKSEGDITHKNNKINNIQVEINNEDEINKKNDNDIVSDIIKRWSLSWQSKNLEEYFAYYQKGFTSDSFSNNELWKKYRSNNIKGKSSINLDIKDLSITFTINEDEIAIAKFTQHYKSESYSDTVTKKITLKKTGSDWKIISEDIVQ